MIFSKRKLIISNGKWLAILIAAWVWLIGIGNIEGKFFPAAVPMELEYAVSTGISQPLSRHDDYDAVETPDGQYTAIWLKSARLRHPECKPEYIVWRLGDRGGNHVPIEYHWGPPEVKGDGVFHAGPWIVKLPLSELMNSFADVFHRCSMFGIEFPWLTKSRFWN